MTIEDQYKLLVGALCGVRYLDDYDLKEYLTQDIRQYIKEFVDLYLYDGYDYKGKAQLFEKQLSKKEKLQDALIVLNNMNESMDVILTVRKYLKEEEDKK